MAQRVNTRFVSIVGIICAVLAVGLIAGPWVKQRLMVGTVPERVAAARENAKKAVTEGRYRDARDLINSAWRLDPTNKELCVERGDIQAMMTQEDGPVAMEQARTSWENALAIDPTYRPALKRLLDTYIEQLEVRPTAATCLRLRDAAIRSVQIDPTDMRAKAYIYIATIQQWVQGMPAPAEESSQAVVHLAELQKQDPSMAMVLFYLVRARTFQAGLDYGSGHVDVSKKSIAECRSLIDSVVAAHPNDAALCFRAFQGYVMLMDADHDIDLLNKDHVSADAALARARAEVKIGDPRFDDCQYIAANWAKRNGHLDEAEKILREFYALKKSDQHVRLELCRILSLTGDPVKRAEAIKILGQPIVSTGATGSKTLGTVELEAQTLLEITSMRVAQYSTLELSQRAAAMEEIDEGLKKIKRITDVDRIPVLRLEGLVAQLKGENVEAVEALSKAMTLLEHSDPNDPNKYDLMYQLAMVERLAQQNRAAEKWFIKIIERYDTYVPARLQLASLYLEENNFPEAGRQIDWLNKQKPGTPDVLRLQIMLKQRLGKRDEALPLVAQLPEIKFEDKLAKAQLSANLQDYPTAIRLLNAMLTEHPDDSGISIALYQAYAKSGPGMHDKAKKVLEDALKLHPNDARLTMLIKQDENASPEAISAALDDVVARTGEPFFVKIREARRALGQNNLPEALARTQEADQIRHNDPTAWGMFFDIYLQQQNWEMTDRAIENLGRMNADQAGGRMYRWKVYMARAQYNEAITVARELTVMRENFGQSWILLGRAYQANGQFTEAIKEYQAALERQTTNIDAYNGLADCYEALSQPDRMYEAVMQGLRLFPDSIPLRERKLGYLSNLDPVAVVPERQKLLEDNPGDPENYLAMASACVLAAQKVLAVDPPRAQAFADQARDVLTKGVGKFPDHLRLNGSLADAMLNSRQFDAGLKILQDVAAQPTWKDKPEPALMIGEYYARDKHVPEAEKAFRDAWARTGNKNIDIELRIAGLLQDQKSYDKALEVLTVNASDPRIARQALQVHIAANHTELARKGLEDAIRQNPGDVSMLDLLALVDIDGGRFADARGVLAKSLALDPRNNISLYFQALAELRDPVNCDLDLALRNLTAVINTAPRNSQFRIESANAKLRARDPDGAAGELEETLRFEFFNRDARLRLLDLYTQQKKWAKFEQYVTVAEQNPVISEAVWFRMHAYALAAQQRFPAAVAKIREAIAIDQKNPIFAKDYLVILLQSKDYEAVRNETDRLLESGHQEWWVFEIRGMARAGAGDKPGAMEQFDRAIALADAAKDADAYQQILNAIADVSIDEAISRVSTRVESNDRWRLQSVMLHMRRNDFATAMSELDPVLKKRDQLSQDQRFVAFRLAAECSQAAGHPEAAKKWYLEWLNEAPNDAAALNNFAYLLAEDLHDPISAKKYSQQAYDTGRKLKYADPLIVDTYGWILILCGGNDTNIGLSILTSLVDGHGELVDARYHLAMGYMKRNRPTDAVAQLKAALDLIKDLEGKGQVVTPQLKRNIESELAKAQQASASTR